MEWQFTVTLTMGKLHYRLRIIILIIKSLLCLMCTTFENTIRIKILLHYNLESDDVGMWNLFWSLPTCSFESEWILQWFRWVLSTAMEPYHQFLYSNLHTLQKPGLIEDFHGINMANNSVVSQFQYLIFWW